MDQNLSGLVALQLVQPWWIPWIPAIIGVFGAIVGAFASGCTIYYMQKFKMKNELGEKRKQIFSDISGIQCLIVQLFYMHAYSMVYSEYHKSQARSKLNMKLQNEGPFKNIDDLNRFINESPEGRQFNEEFEKTEKYALQIAQIKRQLWKRIGLVQVSFNQTEELDRLISKIETALNDYDKKISMPEEGADVNQIIQWKKDIMDNALPKYIDSDINPAIDNLLKYLRSEI
ncbi:MAG: hypothetical protein HPY61_07725 [Methanotrichaceae archaeon]|nr:hypothetical protein [Methanotrichaceae archaeon]